VSGHNATGLKVPSGERPTPVKVVFKAGGQAFQGTTSHFDETGLLLQCATPFPVNVRLELELYFEGLQNPLEIRGEVVWSNVFGPDDALTPRAMGVKFLNLDNDLSRTLAQLAEGYQVYGDQYRCFYT